MGGQDTPEVRQRIVTQVTNELNVKISTITQTITNIVNQTSTSVTTEVVNTASGSVDTNIVCSNELNVGGSIVASGHSSINVAQTCDMKVENQAIISIVQDTSSMNSLGSEIASKVNEQIQSGNAKNDVNTLAKIAQQTKDAGGPEQLITKMLNDTIMPMMMAGSSESDIRNTININIENTNITSTNISNIVNTAISAKISNAASASCNLNVQGSNQTDVAGSIISTDYSNINIKQSVSIDAFQKCMIDLKMGDAIKDKILDGKTYTIPKIPTNSPPTTNPTTSLTTKPNSTTSLTTKPNPTTSLTTKPIDSVTPTTVSNSPTSGLVSLTTNPATSESNNNVLYISLGVGGLVVFLILIFFLTRKSNDYYQQGGGLNECNLYLYAALFTLFLYISSKSVTMCGLILIAFVSFVIYSMYV